MMTPAQIEGYPNAHRTCQVKGWGKLPHLLSWVAGALLLALFFPPGPAWAHERFTAFSFRVEGRRVVIEMTLGLNLLRPDRFGVEYQRTGGNHNLLEKLRGPKPLRRGFERSYKFALRNLAAGARYRLRPVYYNNSPYSSHSGKEVGPWETFAIEGPRPAGPPQSPGTPSPPPLPELIPNGHLRVQALNGARPCSASLIRSSIDLSFSLALSGAPDARLMLALEDPARPGSPLLVNGQVHWTMVARPSARLGPQFTFETPVPVTNSPPEYQGPLYVGLQVTDAAGQVVGATDPRNPVSVFPLPPTPCGIPFPPPARPEAVQFQGRNPYTMHLAVLAAHQVPGSLSPVVNGPGETAFWWGGLTNRDFDPRFHAAPSGALRALEVYLGAVPRVLYSYVMGQTAESRTFKICTFPFPNADADTASVSGRPPYKGTVVAPDLWSFTVQEVYCPGCSNQFSYAVSEVPDPHTPFSVKLARAVAAMRSLAIGEQVPAGFEIGPIVAGRMSADTGGIALHCGYRPEGSTGLFRLAKIFFYGGLGVSDDPTFPSGYAVFYNVPASGGVVQTALPPPNFGRQPQVSFVPGSRMTAEDKRFLDRHLRADLGPFNPSGRSEDLAQEYLSFTRIASQVIPSAHGETVREKFMLIYRVFNDDRWGAVFLNVDRQFQRFAGTGQLQVVGTQRSLEAPDRMVVDALAGAGPVSGPIVGTLAATLAVSPDAIQQVIIRRVEETRDPLTSVPPPTSGPATVARSRTFEVEFKLPGAEDPGQAARGRRATVLVVDIYNPAFNVPGNPHGVQEVLWQSATFSPRPGDGVVSTEPQVAH